MSLDGTCTNTVPLCWQRVTTGWDCTCPHVLGHNRNCACQPCKRLRLLDFESEVAGDA